MHLMYTLDDAGNRIYTLKVGIAVAGMCHDLIIAIENHSGRQSDKVCSSRYASFDYGHSRVTARFFFSD
jgi:hypothetical protein